MFLQFYAMHADIIFASNGSLASESGVVIGYAGALVKFLGSSDIPNYYIKNLNTAPVYGIRHVALDTRYELLFDVDSHVTNGSEGEMKLSCTKVRRQLRRDGKVVGTVLQDSCQGPGGIKPSVIYSSKQGPSLEMYTIASSLGYISRDEMRSRFHVLSKGCSPWRR